MRTQTKIIALLLTVAGIQANAMGLTGTKAAVNSNSATITTAPAITGTTFTDGVITVNLNDNHHDGWKIEATSGNTNSSFQNQNVGADLNLDGNELDYTVACNGLTADETNLQGVAAVPAQSLSGTAKTISTVANPTFPSTGSLECQIAVTDGDESVTELFDGTYSETITLTASNL